MAGILRVDTLESDSNLALKIATANVAFIDSNGLNVVGGNLTIGATQFAEGGQIQTSGIADDAITTAKIVNDAITSDKILSVANTKISGVIEVSQLADTLNLASKTVTLPAGVGGKVLQVVSAIVTSTASRATSNFDYGDIGLSVSITPSSATSKVLVFVSIHLGSGNSTGRVGARLLRNSTNIAIGDTAGNRSPATMTLRQASTAQQELLAMNYLDSPATTSSTTYKIQVSGEDTNTVYMNRSSEDSDNAFHYRPVSVITVMEIAA